MNKYIGISLIVISIGIIIYLLAISGFNTYFSITKEKIEVTTHNSNFLNNTTEEK